MWGKITSFKACNNDGVNLLKFKQRAGYAKRAPSGILIPYLMHLRIIDATKFPPAESPTRITFVGYISKTLFT